MTEKEVGKIAAEMVQSSLRKTILNQGFLRNSWNNKQKDWISLSKASGVARMSKYYPGELWGIAVKMGRHGFILNTGVDTNRRGGIVHRKQPRSTFYKRKSHPFKIESKPFIDTAVEQSGAVEYLGTMIGEIRLDAIVEQIKYGFKNG